MLECKSQHSEKEKPNSQFKILLNRKNNRDVGTMAIGVVEFSREGYKIRKVFAYQHAQRKLLNFEN